MPQVCADLHLSHGKGNVVGSHSPQKDQPGCAPPDLVRALYPAIEKKLTLEEIQAEITGGNWGEGCRTADYGAFLRNPEQAYHEAMAILEAVEKALLCDPKRFGGLPSKQIKAMGKWTRDFIKVSFMLWTREIFPDKVCPCWQGGAAPTVAFIVPPRAEVRGPFFPEETVAHMPLTYFMDRNLLLSLHPRLPPSILNYAQRSALEDGWYPLVTIAVPPITAELIRLGRSSVPLIREMITAISQWCSWAGIRIMAQ